MLKRLLIGIFSLALLAGPVHGAGSISLSLTQQLDSQGRPLNGGKVYFYQAGTVATPQNAYQDSALTIPHPNPITLNARGFIPQLFFADGSIKVRITNADGVPQLEQDGILVIGASSGGGGGSPVDATTIFQTGDVMWLDVDGTRSGWVRDNGRTIGSATSGATERANADTQALYEFLWNTYSNTICPVSGGRGANAAADFAANKAIGTPNKQGLIAGGTDGMGASASSIWASVPVVSGSVTTAGSVIGETLHALTSAENGPHTHTGTTDSGGVDHTHNYNTSGNKTGLGQVAGSAIFWQSGSGNPDVASSGASAYLHTHTFTTASSGSGTPHNTVQKTVLGTFYRKL